MFQQFQLEIFLRNFGHGHLTDILLNEKLEALFSSEKSYFKRTRVTDKKHFFLSFSGIELVSFWHTKIIQLGFSERQQQLAIVQSGRAKLTIRHAAHKIFRYIQRNDESKQIRLCGKLACAKCPKTIWEVTKLYSKFFWLNFLVCFPIISAPF